MLDKMFFTLTGLCYRYGQEFIEPGMRLSLKKEPDNEYDSEAIAVSLEPLGKIGYVANSVGTVIGDCMSAGRLYDKIGDTAEAEVIYKLPQGVVCRIA